MSVLKLPFRVSKREKWMAGACAAYPVFTFLCGLTPGGMTFFAGTTWGTVVLMCNLPYTALCLGYYLLVSESRHKIQKALLACALVASLMLALWVVEVQCWRLMHGMDWELGEQCRYTVRFFLMQGFGLPFLPLR